jgi:hypothetical protein
MNGASELLPNVERRVGSLGRFLVVLQMWICAF